jgi:hypothetical protein
MTHVKNLSLAILKSMVMLMLFTFTLASCKKDHDDIKPQPVPVSVEGTYTGKYGFGNEVPDTDQKYAIKAGGVFQEIGLNSGAVMGSGVWQLNGNILTAQYTMNFAPFSKYSIKATFNSSNGKLVGTWGGPNDPADGGKIDMTRQ